MLLYGTDLADYIKERHGRQVRELKSPPKLLIVWCGNDPATERYINSKRRYGIDVGVTVEVKRVEATTAAVRSAVEAANLNASVGGLIVQLPLPIGVDPEPVLAAITPGKDVDGLGKNSPFEPATPKAILWLLASRGVELKGLAVTVVGQGRLVGRPLTKLLEAAGADVRVGDVGTEDLASITAGAEIVVSATGQPGLITADLVKPGAILIDAGTSVVDDRLVGDVDPALYDRSDLTITPVPGGVGPLTVAALFDNLFIAVNR